MSKRYHPTGTRGGKRAASPAFSHDLAYTDEEREFLVAVQAWKARTKRLFPTLTELLGVLKGLGYDRAAKDRLILAMGDRILAQSELLSRRAERK